MSALQSFRERNPAYRDVPDEKLAPALHRRFYASIPEAEFYERIGFKATPSAPERGPIARAFGALDDARRRMAEQTTADQSTLPEVKLTDEPIQLLRNREPGSVMADYDAPAAAPGRERTPVRPEVRQQERAAWEGATPEQRAAMEARDGWRGTLARQTADDYSDAPEHAADTRREAIVRREVGRGAAPEVAANLADHGDGRPSASLTVYEETLADQLGRMAAERTGSDQAQAIITRAVDVAGTVAKVAPTTGKMVLDAVQLVPVIGQVAEWGSDILADVIEDIGARQSRELQGKSAQLAETLRNGNPAQVTQLLLANPDLLSDVAIPSAGSIFVIGGAGAAIGKAQASRYASQVSPRALARIQQRAATDGAIWTNAAVNAGAAFDETDGPLAAKYVAALIAGAGTRAAGLATRGGAEGVIARGGAGTDRARAIVSTGGREYMQEYAEGASEALGVQTGSALSGTGDGFSLRQIANQGAVEAAAGGVLGAAVGAGYTRSPAPVADLTDGVRFDPTEIQRAAIDSLDPARAQIELVLAQRADAAAATGDPVEIVLAQAEASVIRRQFDVQAAAQALASVPPTDALPAIDRMTPEQRVEAAKLLMAGNIETEAAAIDQADLLSRIQQATGNPQPLQAAAGTGWGMVVDQGAPLEQEAAAMPLPEQAQQEATQPEPATPPMLMSNGRPFRTARLAASSARQRGLDMVPVEVEGGWGLVPNTAQAIKPLDHGELNIPGRTSTIDRDLDRHKADQARQQREQQKAETAQRKADKTEARRLHAELGKAIVDRHGDKFGRKKLEAELDQMVKWEPKKFIDLANKFMAEQAATPAPTETVPTETTPMLASNGQPFASAKLAASSARQRKLDMRPVAVEGGWGLMPTDQAPLPKPWELNQDDFVALARIERDGNRWSARWNDQYLEGGNEEFTHPDLGKTVVNGGRFFGTRREVEIVARGAHKRAVRRALMNGEKVGADVLAMYPELAPTETTTSRGTRYDVVRPDGTVFGSYTAQADAQGALARAGSGATIVDRQAPKQAPAPKKAARNDGRAALLEQIEQAKTKTGDPELVAEYALLLAEAQDKRRRASLKKTTAKEATELAKRADHLENNLLPNLRKRIGFVTFKTPTGRYRVLNTPANLEAFAKRVKATTAFKRLPTDIEAIYDNIETRPGTTDAQRASGRSALGALVASINARALRSGGGSVSVLGSALYEGFHATGGVSLRGQTIQSPADLATLAQIFRDPRFETFRVFYTDDTGQIVGEAGYSSRLPAAVYLPAELDKQIAKDTKAFGATRYWVLHNHPSGKAKPSPADRKLTRDIASKAPGFAGHVVIDRNEYAVIEADGSDRVIQAPGLDGIDFASRPELEHKLLGMRVNQPTDVATIAKALQIENGHATLILTRRQGEVQLLVDIPAAMLNDMSKLGLAKLKGVIRRAARAVGAGGNRFIVLPTNAPVSQYGPLIALGIFRDVVAADGRSADPTGSRWTEDFLDQPGKTAARISEPYSYESEYLATAEQYGGREAWQAAKDAGHTKLNYRQWVQVRTPAFIQWFGDWQHGQDQALADESARRPEQAADASSTAEAGGRADRRRDRLVAPVTLDPDTGEPRVFYHGTSDDFRQFDFDHPRRKDAGWLGRGAYVSSDDFIAETYARIKGGDAAPNIMPVFVRASNPYVADLEVKRKLSKVSKGTIDALTRRMRDAGHDGAALTFPDGTVEMATFDPTSIKSAIANRGAFDPLDADIIAEPAGPYDRPSPPAETRFRRFQRAWQDKLNRFSVIQDWLKSQGVNLTEQANVYRAEERMHGRVATRFEDFREKRVKPIIEEIRKAGFDLAEVADFLHAQHAQERNEQIARINSAMPDGGSGMSTAEAQAKLRVYRKKPELVRLANKLQAITSDTRDILLKSGIITQEMADAWTATYQHYVPLKGAPDAEAAQQGTGKGLTVKHKNKRALGHTGRDEWIIENMLRDHERAILQAEKNRVGQHLLALALEAANEELITIGQPVKRQVLKDQKTHEVRYQGAVVEVFRNLADAQRYIGQENMRPGRKPGDFDIHTSHDMDVVLAPSPSLDPSETQVYVNGHAIRVQFKDELLARAYNNMGSEHMALIFRMARDVNTWLSRAYTGYNPEFLSVNVMRDFTTGIVNLTGEEGAGFAARTVKNYPRAFGELLRYAFTGNASNWIKQYRADGGTTGAAYLSDLERVGKDIQGAYDEYAGVMQTMANGGPRRAARAAARKTIGALVGWIEKLNQAGENAMRLAAYRTAVEGGLSRAKAASLAKNSTVNFNRKGEMGSQMAALYLFFNPAVQGTASIAHALFKGKHKHQAQALTGALIGLGYLVAATRGGGDEDEWEKLGEFQKERYLPVWTGNGWAMIPMAYGYGFFYSLGRHLRAIEEGADPAATSVKIAASFVEEFSVWGAAADAEGDERNVMFLLPTIPQIVLGPIVNRTGLGAPIYPESPFDTSRPDNLKMWRGTQGTAWAWAARELNAITGGNAVEKGWLDVSPETMKFLWRTATGGAGRFVVDSVALGWNLGVEGVPVSDIELREVPIARKFHTKANDVRGARARFWKAAEEVREAQDAFARAKRIADHSERRDMLQRVLEENRELLILGSALRSHTEAIAFQRDATQTIMADQTLSLTERRRRVKEIEAKEVELYDRFVKLFKQQKEKQK